MYVNLKLVRLNWLKQSSLCPVVLANLGNQTVLYYVQTKLQSFSNGGYHNRKLESVCPRKKIPENNIGYAKLP